MVYRANIGFFLIRAHRNRSRRNTPDTTSSFNNNRENGGSSPGSVTSSSCQGLRSFHITVLQNLAV